MPPAHSLVVLLISYLSQGPGMWQTAVGEAPAWAATQGARRHDMAVCQYRIWQKVSSQIFRPVQVAEYVTLLQTSCFLWMLVSDSSTTIVDKVHASIQKKQLVQGTAKYADPFQLTMLGLRLRLPNYMHPRSAAKHGNASLARLNYTTCCLLIQCLQSPGRHRAPTHRPS